MSARDDAAIQAPHAIMDRLNAQAVALPAAPLKLEPGRPTCAYCDAPLRRLLVGTAFRTRCGACDVIWVLKMKEGEA